MPLLVFSPSIFFVSTYSRCFSDKNYYHRACPSVGQGHGDTEKIKKRDFIKSDPERSGSDLIKWLVFWRGKEMLQRMSSFTCGMNFDQHLLSPSSSRYHCCVNLSQIVFNHSSASFHVNGNLMQIYTTSAPCPRLAGQAPCLPRLWRGLRGEFFPILPTYSSEDPKKKIPSRAATSIFCWKSIVQ